VHDLMDNLARYAVPAPAPGALLTLTASNFTRVLHAAPLMLVAFSVRWCARCAALSAQLHRAAILLPSLQPAIDASIATIDMDDPQNAPLLREVGAARCNRCALASLTLELIQPQPGSTTRHSFDMATQRP